MNGRFLLDTTIAIGIFGRDEKILQQLTRAGEIFLSSIALGELYYGAFRSGRVEANLARIAELAASVPVLSCDELTSRHYGETKKSLKEKGRPIPENDLWIAALAKQHGLTVASRDDHFNQVEGLPVETW